MRFSEPDQMVARLLAPTAHEAIDHLSEAMAQAKTAYEQSRQDLEDALWQLQGSCAHVRVVERESRCGDFSYIFERRLCLDCGLLEDHQTGGFYTLKNPVAVLTDTEFKVLWPEPIAHFTRYCWGCKTSHDHRLFKQSDRCQECTAKRLASA